MNEIARQRLFGIHDALDHPVTRTLSIVIVALLAIAPMAIAFLHATGSVTDAHRRELVDRWKSWLILTPMMFGPVLLGAFWTMLAAALLSVCCHMEFTRSAGIQREWSISAIVIAGVFGLMFACVVGSYPLFAAVVPITCGAICGGAVLAGRPKGYLHRVPLGIFSFILFGVCLGHLGLFTLDPNYRPILFLLIVCVQLNDVLAYICGKLVGGPKLAPATSPNKTLSGAIGAITITTLLFALIGQSVFRGTPLDARSHLIAMGLIAGVLGVLGDLVLSSIKRDLGIKDMAATFPGHGGWLDRFNSLLLVAPAIFYYVAFFRGGALGAMPRFFTGG